MATSILHYGVLQPLSVRRREDGYELVAGERRLPGSKNRRSDGSPLYFIAGG